MGRLGQNPYKMKRGDLEPFEAILTDRDGKPVTPGNEDEVFFLMRPITAGMGVSPVRGTAENGESPGQVSYTPVDADVSIPGPYRVEFEVLGPDGPRTYPPDGYYEVLILEDLDSDFAPPG